MAILLLAGFMSVAMAATSAGTKTNTVYKCTGAAVGSVIYQDAPCAPGTELRNFATDPPALSVVPGTPVPRASAKLATTAKAERASASSGSRTTAGHLSMASERRFIKVGMTEAEVLTRIGKPDVDAARQRDKGTRWSYLPRDGDPNTITTLTLVNGLVASVERKLVR